MPSAPRAFGRLAALAIVAFGLAGCATVEVPSSGTLLSEDQIVDLMRHPLRWYGRTVTVRIYPYDNGFRESYRVCFERCEAADAGRRAYVIYTRADRFKDYRGDRPVVVTARYASACVELPAVGGGTAPVCPDLVSEAFIER